MKQTHNYEVNFAEQKIIVTKKFAKAAGVIGSTQYKELAQIRHDFPDFTIELREIKRKEGKRTYGKLTYQAMEDFITEFEEENAPAILDELERMKALSKAYAGKYAFVKTWFLNRYKDVFKQEDSREAVA